MREFTYAQTHDGQWEVLIRGVGGRKAHLPRRLALCAHDDDAKCIAEAMREYEKETPRPVRAEYWEG